MEQLGAVLDKAKNLQMAHEESLQKIVQLMTDGPHKEQMGSMRFWHECLPGLDASSLRNIMKQLPEEERSVTLLFAPGLKSSFILWTKSMPNDASYYIKEPVVELGGHGGGSKDSFTGGFADVKNALDLYQQLVEKVKKRISGT
jgi:alanyl-tRNA synthetase